MLHRARFWRSAGIRRAFVSVVAASAAACGGGDPGTGPNPGPGTTTGSFTLGSASSLSLAAGASGTVTVTIARRGAFAGPVSLAVSGLPAGVTGTFNPAAVAAGETTSTLTLTTAATSGAGTTSVTITASATGVANQTATVALTITAGPAAGPVTMALSVSSYLTLPSNHLPAMPTLTVTRNPGFSGAIVLTTTGLPATLVVAFAPNNLTGTTSKAAILDLGGTPPGTYTATVRGAAAGGLGDRTITFQVVVAPPSVGSIRWKFCSGSLPQYFFAVKDGNGPWTRIMPSADSGYSFNITSATGSVATVTNDSGGYRTIVYQYTAAELAARAASQCALEPNVTTRTATGTFGGVTGFRVALAAMGSWFGSANGNGSFSLLNLPPGPLDLVAARNGDATANFEFPLDRVIIRRATNPASGSAVPVVDFNAAESFAPTSATWTFNNVNPGEQFSVSQLFITAGGTSGMFQIYPNADRSATTRTIYSVPAAQMIAGDLHQVVATINTAGIPAAAPNRNSRQIITYGRTLGDRTIAFGPAMPAPAVTAVAGGPGRLRAVGTLPTEYAAGVSFDVTQTTTARFATVYTTRGFLGTTGTYDVQVPDLRSVIGWDSEFALRGGVAANWWVSGGGPSLDFFDARFGSHNVHSRWTGTQTGIVAPADGATYLMARAIGTTTP